MPGFSRRVEPVVVASVHVVDRNRGQLGRIDVIEGSEADGDIVAADRFDIAAAEWGDAAGGAEGMVAASGCELVVGKAVLAADQAEVGRLDDGRPGAPLGADRAIALARA